MVRIRFRIWIFASFLIFEGIGRIFDFKSSSDLGGFIFLMVRGGVFGLGFVVIIRFIGKRNFGLF